MLMTNALTLTQIKSDFSSISMLAPPSTNVSSSTYAHLLPFFVCVKKVTLSSRMPISVKLSAAAICRATREQSEMPDENAGEED